MNETTSRPKLGLALGGGAALGISHIGVLRELDEAGIRPDVIAGTSIGGVVGAAYLFDRLDRLETFARAVGWREVARLTDVGFRKGGFLSGSAIMKEIRGYIGEARFADADRPFAMVASDLRRNEEVVIDDGDVADALRATISIPGVFTPVVRGDRVLVDGGIKNPVPVSVARQLGADVVVAVDVTGDYAGQADAAGMVDGQPFKGGLYEVATLSIAMIMAQIAEANYKLSPPDLRIVPRIGHMRPYEFDRGEALIAAGRNAARDAIAQLRSLMDATPTPPMGGKTGDRVAG